MFTLSRRGFFGMLSGTLGAGLAAQGGSVAQAAALPIYPTREAEVARGWTQYDLIAECLGQEISWYGEGYDEWFDGIELESYRRDVMMVSVPEKQYTKELIRQRADKLLAMARVAAPRTERVEVVLRRV